MDPGTSIWLDLSSQSWPPQRRFPVNHAGAHVRDVISADLKVSDAPLLIAGYSSIAALIQLISDWRHARGDRPGEVRLLLGSEPFPSQRTRFGSPHEQFTEEVREYWLEHSISVHLSAQVIRAVEELNAGSLQVRVLPGASQLHAKVYIGDQAAAVGSSNYTEHGLARQLEANARFEKADDSVRYRELVVVGNNYWLRGLPWLDEFRDLLHRLLQVVTWQEALARACGELLEGDWADRLPDDQARRAELWPSQKAGIARAMWVWKIWAVSS